jgi:hypothetical protein
MTGDTIRSVATALGIGDLVDLTLRVRPHHAERDAYGAALNG